MQKGTALSAIQEEDINDEGTALVKDIEITLPATRPDGNHTLKKPLEVQTQSGRRLGLLENTVFHYTLPETKAGYIEFTAGPFEGGGISTGNAVLLY
jgi:hypothetical protein